MISSLHSTLKIGIYHHRLAWRYGSENPKRQERISLYRFLISFLLWASQCTKPLINIETQRHLLPPDQTSYLLVISTWMLKLSMSQTESFICHSNWVLPTPFLASINNDADLVWIRVEGSCDKCLVLSPWQYWWIVKSLRGEA